MKLFSTLFGMAAAGALGYFAEPSLRFQLTGTQPSAVEVAKDKRVMLQFPGETPQIDLSTLSPEQLPQRVLLNTDVKVTDAGSGVTMLIQAGNRVKLVRIEGGNVVVSPGEGPFLGRVPITDTDLVKQIAAKPPQTPAPVVPPAAVAPVPVIPATGDSEEPVKTPEPAPVPAPAPMPEPTPSAPEPAPAAAPAPAEVAGSPDVVTAMQQSIKAGQIKEFTFEQVLEWNPGTDEIVDGETYQTGLAAYKAETIFGVKTIQAKALIKAGKVQRWIWPKSGMEIK